MLCQVYQFPAPTRRSAPQLTAAERALQQIRSAAGTLMQEVHAAREVGDATRLNGLITTCAVELLAARQVAQFQQKALAAGGRS